MSLPKRKYNTISAIADEIWQYRTGGNLTILTKITTLQKQGSCSQAYGFAKITTYSWWQSGEIGALALRNFKFGTRIQSTLFGCPGESPWLPWRFALVGQENQIEDVRFLFSPVTTPPLWPPKREYNAVFTEGSMKFGNIIRGDT